jgi:hypothetical protein
MSSDQIYGPVVQLMPPTIVLTYITPKKEIVGFEITNYRICPTYCDVSKRK